MMTAIDAKLAAIYTETTMGEHAKKKDMWLGARKMAAGAEYIFAEGPPPRAELRKVKYSQALYKCFDEILVNARDEWRKSAGRRRGKVTQIAIEFRDDGYITIFNDGDGIPIALVADKGGAAVYVPELVSTRFLAGSNNEVDETRTTGGTNGLGMTLVNNSSDHFVLITADTGRGLMYRQECRGRLATIGAPLVTPLKDAAADDPHRRGGTTVSFRPAYADFECGAADFGVLRDLFRVRAYHMAAHTGADVWFNGAAVRVSVAELGAIYAAGECVPIDLKHSLYPWRVAVGVSRSGKFEAVSVMNGVYVKEGSHIDCVRGMVLDGLRGRADKLLKAFHAFRANMLTANLFILISGEIPSPSFDSQVKTRIADPAAKFAEYKIGAAALGRIWDILSARLTELYVLKAAAVPKKKGTADIDKYSRAKYAGTARRGETTLIICEGDSAQTLVNTALRNPRIPMGTDMYGTFNIGGVPINSRKHCKAIGAVIVRDKKLAECERIVSLERVLGLEAGRRYETAEERAALNYGRIVAAVDQDVDGVGQILGLITAHIGYFWPGLIAAGYLQYMITPIIRAYPRGAGRERKIVSFYSDAQYRRWAGAEAKQGAGAAGAWDIQYYKGLGTHSKDEAVDMFLRFEECRRVLRMDAAAEVTMNIYFGPTPALRRIELSRPERAEPPEGCETTVTEHYKSYCKEFQLDNIRRKLPDLDGLNPSRRKVLCAARIRARGGNAPIKVFQLAGFVADRMKYHHGSASLEETIVNMAQDFIGANNLPLLLPLSQFGTWADGPKIHAAARYINTRLNVALVSRLFPADDDYVLDYVYDEGEKVEPVRYAPIMPLGLLESLRIPATGWAYEGYARNWDDVAANVRAAIAGAPGAGPMRFWFGRWGGALRQSGDLWYSVGRYVCDADAGVVYITALPFRVWVVPYVKMIAAKEHVADVENLSTDDMIDIRVTLAPGGYEAIIAAARGDPAFDAIEDYLHLRERMGRSLVLVGPMAAKEYKSYGAIFADWFAMRWRVYMLRVRRVHELNRLRLMLEENMARFVGMYGEIEFHKIGREAADAALRGRGFCLFNRGLLDEPRDTPTDELERATMRRPGAEGGEAGAEGAAAGEEAEGAAVSYKYLYSINATQCMERARVARAARIDELRGAVAAYEAEGAEATVRRVWGTELDALDVTVKEAAADPRGWRFKESRAAF